jgi:hypothetical protein
MGNLFGSPKKDKAAAAPADTHTRNVNPKAGITVRHRRGGRGRGRHTGGEERERGSSRLTASPLLSLPPVSSSLSSSPSLPPSLPLLSL